MWSIRLRLSAVFAVASLALFAGPLLPQSAQASIGGCRSDPYVILSNGAQIDLSASISDDISDVKSVTYVLHGPVGVRPVLVVPTDGLMGWLETFRYYSDAPARTYNAYTTVTTGAAQAPVTATAGIASLGPIGVTSANGSSNQTLFIHVTG